MLQDLDDQLVVSDDESIASEDPTYPERMNENIVKQLVREKFPVDIQAIMNYCMIPGGILEQFDMERKVKNNSGQLLQRQQLGREDGQPYHGRAKGTWAKGLRLEVPRMRARRQVRRGLRSQFNELQPAHLRLRIEACRRAVDSSQGHPVQE